MSTPVANAAAKGPSPKPATYVRPPSPHRGAWAYRYPAKVSRHLQCGWKHDHRPSRTLAGKPRCACASVSDTSRHAGKHANQVVVAIAREMAAFIWAIAREVPMAR